MKWVSAALCCAVMLSAGGASAEPLFQVQPGGDRLFLPPPEGTPTRTFELRYTDEFPWRGGEAVTRDLEARAFPEAVTIVGIDEAAHVVRLITTEYGSAQFRNVPAKLSSTEAPGAELACSAVFATLVFGKTQRGPDDNPLVRRDEPCPLAAEIQPHRQLIVEGLDRRGKRLFTALSDDPRWSIAESVGADGKLRLEHMGRTDAPSTYVSFRAVIDERLKTLRIWQIDDANKPHAIGDIPWNDVEIKP